MFIFSILVSAVVLLGAITMHVAFSYAEHKGYERGLDEAEQIINEVRSR